MTATMLFKECDEFTTAYYYGGELEFDTGVIRNTFKNGDAPRSQKVEFPVALFGAVFTDAGSLADEMERRGYTRLVV